MQTPPDITGAALPRLLALGDCALTLSFEQRIDPDTHARVLGVEKALEALKGSAALRGVEEWVASFCALTVYFDPDIARADVLGETLLSLAATGERATLAGLEWHLPVCFEAEFAPDLAGLAAAKGLSVDAVVSLLTGTRFRVYTIGFLPGFPYLGGLPEALEVARLASPRSHVPARSVAVAGTMCALYPWESPGGWHLVGRTPVPVFDAANEARPALLTPGDSVFWRGVNREDFLALETSAGAGTLDVARFSRKAEAI